jgi:hypothetical protein
LNTSNSDGVGAGADTGNANADLNNGASSTGASAASGDVSQVDSGDDVAKLRAALQAERAEKSRLAAQIHDLKPLAEQARLLEEANKSEVEKLREKLAAATAEQERATLAQLRHEAALAAAPEGVDSKQIQLLAGRLQGATLEELTADATTLFSQFTPQRKSIGATKPLEDLQPGGLVSGGDVNLDKLIADAEAKGDVATSLRLKAAKLHQSKNVS